MDVGPRKFQAGLEAERSWWPHGQKVGSGPLTTWGEAEFPRPGRGGSSGAEPRAETWPGPGASKGWDSCIHGVRRAGQPQTVGTQETQCRGVWSHLLPHTGRQAAAATELATPRSPWRAPFLRDIIALNDPLAFGDLVQPLPVLLLVSASVLGTVPLKIGPQGSWVPRTPSFPCVASLGVSDLTSRSPWGHGVIVTQLLLRTVRPLGL